MIEPDIESHFLLCFAASERLVTPRHASLILPTLFLRAIVMFASAAQQQVNGCLLACKKDQQYIEFINIRHNY